MHAKGTRSSVETPQTATFDTSDQTAELQSTTLGKYHRSHSLIHLSRDGSFFHPDNLDDEGTQTLFRWSVFIHEYLHFIHNFSTVVGLHDFLMALRLLGPFISTVGRAGDSSGSENLSPEARAEIESIAIWRSALVGGASPATTQTINRVQSHLNLASIFSQKLELAIGSTRISGVVTTACFQPPSLSKTEQLLEVRIGSEILMEGCAYEAECLIMEKNGHPIESLHQLIPNYPYRTARAIFEEISGISPSHKYLCSVCVLALQCTDPGNAFVELARSSRQLRNDISEDDLLTAFQTTSSPYFKSQIRRLLDELLPLEISPFLARGRAGRGLTLMINWATNFFERRLEDNLFEINALAQAPDNGPIVELLRSMPACPIMQDLDGFNEEAELFVLSDTDIETERMEELGAAQSLLHFSGSHLLGGRILGTSNCAPRPCFFVKCCRASRERADRTVCFQSPWLSFEPNNLTGCWYAQGVAAARGKNTHVKTTPTASRRPSSAPSKYGIHKARCPFGIRMRDRRRCVPRRPFQYLKES